MRTVLCLFVLGLARIAELAGPVDVVVSPWTYRCDASNSTVGGNYPGPRCIKETRLAQEPAVGLNACKMRCGDAGRLWPRPTGVIHLSQDLVNNFYPQDVQVVVTGSPSSEVEGMMRVFADVWREYLFMKHPSYGGQRQNPFPTRKAADAAPSITVSITIESSSLALNSDTDESYSLRIERAQGKREAETLAVSIRAPTYYGARHAMETLSQLISLDELTFALQIYAAAQVTDKPVFRHRGLLIDTSRNYINLPTIKSIISAMSYDKLNVFHWHITDTHSFPMVSSRLPQLAQLGAYSAHKVYSAEAIREVVQYAKLRGVRVLAEFDAPAHVGNGWQFANEEAAANGQPRPVLCLNQEPWEQYCVEPPCGQFNPVSQAVYPLLGQLYQDFFELFPDMDMFHMGGDEVNLNCWNSSQEIRDYLAANGQTGTEDELVQLWNLFQTQAAERAYSAAGRKLPLILWTSRLTEKGEVEKYLNKDDYIIQIWTTGDDSVIAELINKGYRLIFSNYDAWYLDCGYGGWVGDGNNWCSPYKGWQTVYDNSPRRLYRAQGGQPANENLILGGEAALWSEQVDSAAVVHKLWPRAAALAERLWSDPEDGGWKQAEIRLVSHRETLVERGIQSDAIQPEWCNQNEGLCYLTVS